MKSIEQILRTASPQVRAICLSLLRQLAKAKKPFHHPPFGDAHGETVSAADFEQGKTTFGNVLADEVDPRSRYADTSVEPKGRKID